MSLTTKPSFDNLHTLTNVLSIKDSTRSYGDKILLACR